MKKLILALVMGLTLVSAPAHATGRIPYGYASKADFRAVYKGEILHNVDHQFGTRGHAIYQGGGYMTRNYRAWNRNTTVQIVYKAGRGHWFVDSKYYFDNTQTGDN